MSERQRIKSEVHAFFDKSLDKFYAIWESIGIPDDAIRARGDTVSLHLQTLISEMLQEEDALKDRMQKSISEFSLQVKELCEELQLPVYKSQSGLPMIQKEKDLRMKVESLSHEKNTRVNDMNRLKGQDQNLCEALCMTPYYIPTGSVPSRDQIKELEKHVASLKSTKDKRLSDFLSTKKDIIKLMDELEQDPETSFEKDVVLEAEDSFILSTDNLKKLLSLQQELLSRREEAKQICNDLWQTVKSLWDRLDISLSERNAFCAGKEGYKRKILQCLREEIIRCEQMKLQNIERFVLGIRNELTSWWDTCFYSKEQREHFDMIFHEDEFTEELLEIHERELAKVKDYYQQNRELLDKVAQRESLFKQFLEAEKNAKDPDRFFKNRGGKLLQMEKDMKKIQKDLPKVEAKVKEAISEWEKENCKQFLVGGVKYDAFIDQQWLDYEESKIKEKEQRHIKKIKQTVEEAHFGTHVSKTTPVKRRLQTPTKTPLQNKSRRVDKSKTSFTASIKMKLSVCQKMNETKTPGSASRLHQRSVFASPLARAPLSVTKLKAKTETPKQKRRSSRLQRKILSEKNKRVQNKAHDHSNVFSRTTVSSGESVLSGDSSLASTGSYQDFATGLTPNARPNCRSSCAMLLSPEHQL